MERKKKILIAIYNLAAGGARYVSHREKVL